MNSLIITAIDGTVFDLFDRTIPCTVVEGKQSCALLSEDTLTLKVKSARPIPLAIGDRCTVFGKKYCLNTVPPVRKIGPRNFVYELVFEGIQYSLMDVQFLLPDYGIGKSLQADLGMFLSVFIDNVNRVYGNWSLGEYPSGTESKNLIFEGENCLEVLQRLCEEYEQEFEIEQTSGGSNVLHIRKAGVIFPYTFQFGSSGGLYELTRSNVNSKNIVTRLFVYGGGNNLGNHYRHSALCLPGKGKNLSLLEDSNAIDRYGVRENTHVFDDIFPNRYGRVTALGGDYVTFTDSTMNFDLNEADGSGTKWLIAGVSAKVHFNTGRLAGYEFEILKDGGYDHATKTIKLIPFTDENGREFPSQDSAVYQLSVGDVYFFKDIRLPDQYITDAEAELLSKGTEYFEQNSQPQVEYALLIHEHFIKQFTGGLNIVNLFAVGDYIHVVDTDVEVNKSIRIAAFTRDVLKPYKYGITLSDVVTRDVFTRVISDVLNLERIIEINQLADPANARRSWRASQEVLAMIFDPEGNYYSENIKPGSIETIMLQVGAKSMQFILRNVIFEPNYLGNPNVLHVSAGQLIHYTIEDTNRTWELPTLTFSELVSNTAYYIYARCSKDNNTGNIFLDTAQRKVDYETGYYTFLVGVLNSVETDSDGERPGRIVSLTYGSTTINGRFIRTGRIESSIGAPGYFDVDTMTFVGGLTVLAGSFGYNNFSDKPDLGVYETKAEFNVFANQISGTVTAQGTTINALGNRVTVIESAGFLTTAQGNSLWASKTLENGNTIASYINQNATTIKIQASKVDLIGQVSFSMLDSSTQSKIDGKANTSALGSLAFQSAVGKAMLDSTIISGGYILTSLIQASAIFASYAYLGNFTLSNGWLTCNATPGSDVGYIDMRSSNTRIAFGHDLAPGTAGGGFTTTAIINNLNQAGSGGNTYALSLRAAGSSSVRAIALNASGGITMKGNTSFVEECTLNALPSVGNLKYYRCFVFQPTSGMSVYLPTDSEIDSAFGTFETGKYAVDSSFIRIYLLATRYSTSYARIYPGSSSTQLIDRTGDPISYVELNKGDCCTLTYYNRSWYLSSTNW